MLLLMMVIATFPSIACRRCRENREHAILLEVHCAMCRECKLRRKEKQQLQSSYASSFSVLPISPRGRPRLVQERADQNQLLSVSQKPSEEYVEYPEGCPTPPPCEYDDDSLTQPLTSRITTPTTTTTQKPCPTVRVCKKVKMERPKTTTSSRPKTPSCVACMPACWMTCPGYQRPSEQYQQPLNPYQQPLNPYQQPSQYPEYQPTTTNHPMTMTYPSTFTYTTNPDYYYLYLGVPKKLMTKP
ncbi:hypothetical protein evm_012771 [Chilo suppressalis]|nr:hypothetical protein evm_012771 [Chilo suppressalis]